MFESVIVANRGEIAVRIMRTLRSLGIRSIAVYSDADRHGRHVAAADVARRIGPAAAAHSYLDVERIIEAALATRAQALHPGYGFLSENTKLADACASAGIVFVGPPASAIEAMGDKIRAKATVAAHGVRVVPGVSGVGLDDQQLAERALEVGFPMLIKPSAGGGGKGMRLVHTAEQLPQEIAGAKREARGAFGDDTLLIERYIERPRHIEVQVLADSHGHVVHVGERECSLQRRHQKVIEEAPSPYLTDDHRTELGAQAVAAARACGYVNAGTVEFIVSGERPDDAFFMEMNTRLQVEHPVTEMVWGIDLVEQQLRIAAGEPLGFTQSDLQPRGHAIEARVYAEDPARGFLPTGGTVRSLREPDQLANVRVDSSLQPGTEIGSTYDPMLSKIIAWGADRDAARRTLDMALANTAILGVTTNVAFLRTVLADPDVIAGDVDTGLVERIAAAQPEARIPRDVVIAAALAHLADLRPTARGLAGADDPWHERSGWRLGEPAWTSLRFTGDDGTITVVRVRRAGLGWDAAIDDEVVRVSGTVGDGRLRLDVDGESTEYVVAKSGRTIWLSTAGSSWSLTVPSTLAPGAAAAGHTGATTIRSPMPGTVVALNVAAGDVVDAGTELVVVEAMKMEHSLRAPIASRVEDVVVHVGDPVALNQILVVLEPAATTEEHP